MLFILLFLLKKTMKRLDMIMACDKMLHVYYCIKYLINSI